MPAAGSFVLLNLIVAVILENFATLHNSKPHLIAAADIELFVVAWADFDPDATNFIPTVELPALLLTLPRPFGLKGTSRATEKSAAKFCMQLELPQLPLPTQQAPSPARSFKRASSFWLGDGSGGARKSSEEARAALHQLPLAARVTARLDAQDARLEELRAMLERLVGARLPQEEGGGGGGGGGDMDSDGHHDAALST